MWKITAGMAPSPREMDMPQALCATMMGARLSSHDPEMPFDRTAPAIAPGGLAENANARARI
jgi:hypothetical protein